MTWSIGDSSVQRKMHEVIMFQLVVSISYALLIIFSKEQPDTVLGIALHLWMAASARAIQVLLFFYPSIEASKNVSEGILVYRHVLTMSLFIAACSIMVSIRHWPAWSTTLNAKVHMAGYSKDKRVELATTGYYRMVSAAAAMMFLALFGDPREKASIEWFYSSDWIILRPPLLIGIASAFVLLAVTLRLSANDRFSSRSIRQ